MGREKFDSGYVSMIERNATGLEALKKQETEDVEILHKRVNNTEKKVLNSQWELRLMVLGLALLNVGLNKDTILFILKLLTGGG